VVGFTIENDVIRAAGVCVQHASRLDVEDRDEYMEVIAEYSWGEGGEEEDCGRDDSHVFSL